MHLLTIPVLAFQFAIYFSISQAGKRGYGPLLVVTGGWTLFTLFGSIFTMGLLLLQLLTVAIAFTSGLGNARNSGTAKHPPGSPTAAPPTSEPSASELGIGSWFAVAALMGIGWLVFANSDRPSSQGPNTPKASLAQQPQGAVSPAQGPTSTKPNRPPIKSSAQRSSSPASGSPTADHGKLDARGCLSLADANAIAKCAEQFR